MNKPYEYPTTDSEREHANLILSLRWPDADVGEVRKYRPVIGEWYGATDWIRTNEGWEPVTFVTTRQRVAVVEKSS